MKAPDEGPSWRRRRDLFHREAVLELAKLLAEEEGEAGSATARPLVSDGEDDPEGVEGH